MTNRPRNIGTAAETAVVKALRANGFPHAERRSLKGTLDQGDITGTPGICWEVKGGEMGKTVHGQPKLLTTFLAQTETERVNSNSDFGVLVLQRKGFSDAGRWWAVVRATTLTQLATRVWPTFPGTGCPVWLELADLTAILRRSGYGDELAA